MTPLYDLLAALLLLVVLLWLRNQWVSRRYGQLFALWVAWYGLQRFLLDFTRAGGTNADQMFGSITWSQASGLVMGVLGSGLIMVMSRREAMTADEQDETLLDALQRPE